MYVQLMSSRKTKLFRVVLIDLLLKIKISTHCFAAGFTRGP